jgi:hypothetical protein
MNTYFIEDMNKIANKYNDALPIALANSLKSMKVGTPSFFALL